LHRQATDEQRMHPRPVFFQPGIHAGEWIGFPHAGNDALNGDLCKSESRWLFRRRDAQFCQHKPLKPGIAKNGGGQNARATGGPGILPETNWAHWIPGRTRMTLIFPARVRMHALKFAGRPIISLRLEEKGVSVHSTTRSRSHSWSAEGSGASGSRR
jgi:hypothetical protein